METIIETERLLIRKIDISDKKGMYLLDSDPEVHRYLGAKPISHEEEALTYIEFIQQQYHENGIARWAVIEKETGEFIGWTGFKLITNTINAHTNYLDVGYRFIKSAWGKGYATECGKACMEYAKKHLARYELHAMTEIGNSNSKKVLEKLGFEAVEIFDFEGDPHYWYNLRN